MSRLSKVPQVTAAFWAIKVLATTLGETGGDALSMSLGLGYALSTLIFLGFFAAALAAQLRARRYRPLAYWAVVVATTTVGTTTSDFLDRTAGLGYPLASALLLGGVLLLLWAWKRIVGRVAFEDIATTREELFYWSTILVANTLGTALGDFVADSAGFGFERGALLFSALLGVVALARLAARRLPASALFWSAYVLTRPLGATLGDLLTKPPSDGGLGLGRFASSAAIAGAMLALIAAASRPAPAPRAAA